ncbi:hypothetical protein [Modicisalibacter luteus]|uniref:hypothetical protein n=1 Tax=Modicisalibacter luteus TaxID=453962 RepID=UPI003633C8DF
MSRIQVWSLLGLAAIIWLLALLEPILMPFFVSMILAYLGDPLTDWLEARGSRGGWPLAWFSWCCRWRSARPV